MENNSNQNVLNPVYVDALIGKSRDRTLLKSALNIAVRLAQQYNEIILILFANKSKDSPVTQSKEYIEARNALAFFLPLIKIGNQRLKAMN